MKTSMIMSAFAIAAIGMSAFAGAADAAGKTKSKQLSASRAQVQRACDANGGAAYGTNSNGRYGCLTDSGYIDCDSGGSCEGSRPTRRTSRGRSSSLPPARRR